MVSISSFSSRLLPTVIGCPEPLAEQAIRDAAIEFCERSRVLVVDLEPVALEFGVAEYELEMPSQTRLGHILGVWMDTTLLTPVPLLQANRSTDAGIPKSYHATYVDEAVVVRLAPAPDLATQGDLYARVSVVPTRSATALMAPLFDEWADAVVVGAQARLKQTPGQVFTDVQAGMLCEQKFRHACTAARAQTNTGRVLSSLYVKPRSL